MTEGTLLHAILVSGHCSQIHAD